MFIARKFGRREWIGKVELMGSLVFVGNRGGGEVLDGVNGSWVKDYIRRFIFNISFFV